MTTHATFCDSSRLSLVIACGGTGGHFYPALAIAKRTVDEGGEATLFVAGQRQKQHLKQAQDAGIRAVPVPAVRLPHAGGDRIAFPFRMLSAVLYSRRLLVKLQANAVLAMGSFAAAPVGIAAALVRIPLFLHEGNSVMGRANRTLSRFSRRAALSFPLSNPAACRCETVQTGFPVRGEITRAAEMAADREALCRRWGLDAERKTVLIFGGSQGAQHINATVKAAAPRLAELADKLQLVHLTGGSADVSALADAYARSGLKAEVRAYENDMATLFRLADLVICRAGAATLTELAFFDMSTVLVPLPSAADNHQSENARIFARGRDAVVVPQSEFTDKKLAELVTDWMHEARLREKEEDTPVFVPNPDAAGAVLAMIRVLPAGVSEPAYPALENR